MNTEDLGIQIHDSFIRVSVSLGIDSRLNFRFRFHPETIQVIWHGWSFNTTYLFPVNLSVLEDLLSILNFQL